MVETFDPAAFEAVSDTLYDPGTVYVYVGFCKDDVLPSPKLQFHEVGELLEESLNWTVSGSAPIVTFEVNDTVGGWAYTT
jgi:hypothetical protein